MPKSQMKLTKVQRNAAAWAIGEMADWKDSEEPVGEDGLPRLAGDTLHIDHCKQQAITKMMQLLYTGGGRGGLSLCDMMHAAVEARELRAREMASLARSKSRPHLPIALPPDWIAAVQAAAAERGMSVSEFVRVAIRSKLPADVRKTLSEPRRWNRR